MVVVGYYKHDIISYYRGKYESVLVTYIHQREQKGLAHALMTVEERVDNELIGCSAMTGSKRILIAW